MNRPMYLHQMLLHIGNTSVILNLAIYDLIVDTSPVISVEHLARRMGKGIPDEQTSPSSS